VQIARDSPRGPKSDGCLPSDTKSGFRCEKILLRRRGLQEGIRGISRSGAANGKNGRTDSLAPRRRAFCRVTPGATPDRNTSWLWGLKLLIFVEATPEIDPGPRVLQTGRQDPDPAAPRTRTSAIVAVGTHWPGS